jgi:hypothetical protein
MELPAIDLDGEFEVRVREIDSAATRPQGQSVLLDGFGQAASNKCADEPHLEVSIARLITAKPTSQHTVDLVRMATGCRVKAGDTLAEILETKCALP